MIWKFLGLQKMLDGLFNDGWCNLGLPESVEINEALLSDLHTITKPRRL
ncbi:MAG: hypothetical protein RL682_2343 [Pseudomonadota bacterium]|jgi:hypothetical protein